MFMAIALQSKSTARLRDSGEWEKIAGPITISPLENAVVLRNMRRATKSD